MADGYAIWQTGVTGASGLSLGSLLISGSGGGVDGRAGAGFVGGASSANLGGTTLGYPGAGGSGGLGTGTGGAGAAGQVIIEW